MKLLNQAQSVARIGYVQHLWEIREAIAYLSNSPIKRPGKTPVPYTFERVQNDLEHVKKIKNLIKDCLEAANKGYEINQNDDFYYSYINLPAQLYTDLIAFESILHKMALFKRDYENNGDNTAILGALQLQEDLELQLKKLVSNRLEGDNNPKWEGWYNPKIRRPNNGFPTLGMLEKVEKNLIDLAK